jgi:hypothetical protein
VSFEGRGFDFSLCLRPALPTPKDEAPIVQNLRQFAELHSLFRLRKKLFRVSVIPSEARNLSFFSSASIFGMDRREIPRIARNDRNRDFFHGLYFPLGGAQTNLL